MESNENDPFVLKDHFKANPLYEIYSKRRTDTRFFNAHSDYQQYLKYLAIIWHRIQNECNEIGEYHAEESKIAPEEHSEKWIALNNEQTRVLTMCQCDFETFIMFARRFMDKIGKLIELLIECPKGKHPPKDFTHHKKWFIKYSDSIYSKFLKNKTHWYERDLLLLRDKVISHGGTLTSGAIVSPRTGVGFRKSYGISPLQGEHKEEFLSLKGDYEKRYSDLVIPENDYQMLNHFVREIRRYDMRLEEGDLEKLGRIVQRSGIIVDEDYLESIASHIEDFLQETASIFKQ
jgi:hypothetical protein